MTSQRRAGASSREKLLGSASTAAFKLLNSPHLNVKHNARPCLLLNAALREQDVPLELHPFEDGGHGIGLRKALGKPAEVWPDLFIALARTHGRLG